MDDLPVGWAPEREIGKAGEGGPDRPLLVEGEPVPRWRGARVHGGFGEHLVRIERAQSGRLVAGHGVGPAPLRIDARRGMARGAAETGEERAAAFFVPVPRRRRSAGRSQANVLVAGQVGERSLRRQRVARDPYFKERIFLAAADEVRHLDGVVPGVQFDVGGRFPGAELRFGGDDLSADAEGQTGLPVGGEGEGVLPGGGQAHQAAEPDGVVAVVHLHRQIERKGGDPAHAGRLRPVEIRGRPVEEARHVLVLLRVEEVLELEAAAPLDDQGCLAAKQVDGDVLGLLPRQVERRHAAARPRRSRIDQEVRQRADRRLRIQVGQGDGGDGRLVAAGLGRVAGDATDRVKEPAAALDCGAEAVDGESLREVRGVGPLLRLRGLRPSEGEVAHERLRGSFPLVGFERMEHIRHRRAGLLLMRCGEIVGEPAIGGALGDPIQIGRCPGGDPFRHGLRRRVAGQAVQLAEQDFAERHVAGGPGQSKVLVARHHGHSRGERGLGPDPAGQGQGGDGTSQDHSIGDRSRYRSRRRGN